MRVLFVHAYYQQPGGEDRSVEAEARMLKERGHDIEWLRFDNSTMESWSTWQTARNVVWNPDARRHAVRLISDFRPDIVQVQNVFPGLSPSVHWAAYRAGVPVVQKLSNYRMFCVNGLLYREGAICETCLGRSVAWAGIRHGCYRDSRLMSAGSAGSTAFHRAIGTWDRCIAAYVIPSKDARDRFVSAGLDATRVHVKAQPFDPFPVAGPGGGGYAMFSGRLSAEKGLDTLLDAWEHHDPGLPLKIAGDGPESGKVRDAASRLPGVTWMGRLSHDDLIAALADARVAVVPSRSYESFGRGALEAMAVGTPVVASALGGLRDIVRDGVSGRFFAPGDSRGLTNSLRQVLDDPAGPVEVRRRVRADAVERFSIERNYEQLVSIYARLAA